MSGTYLNPIFSILNNAYIARNFGKINNDQLSMELL